jgi:hypothetical protein
MLGTRSRRSQPICSERALLLWSDENGGIEVMEVMKVMGR